MRDYIKERDQRRDGGRLKLKPKSELHHLENYDISNQKTELLHCAQYKWEILIIHYTFKQQENVPSAAVKKNGDNSCSDKKVGKGRCRQWIRGSVCHSLLYLWHYPCLCLFNCHCLWHHPCLCLCHWHCHCLCLCLSLLVDKGGWLASFKAKLVMDYRCKD